MKLTFLIQEGVYQLILQPETEEENAIFKIIPPTEDYELRIQHSPCWKTTMGNYIRQFDHESGIGIAFVMKRKKNDGD